MPGPAERRLTARSVIASTLLGVDPPELSARSLVSTATLFGISAGTTRVAMSRMVANGELETADGRYRLSSPALLARRTRQDQSRRGATSQPWNGRWRMAVVDAGTARPAADRGDLRAALGALRFAEVHEGTWLRPDNLPRGVLPDAEAVVSEQCLLLHADLDAEEDPRALAADLWDLDSWAASARSLDREVAELGARLEGGDLGALADGFLASAATLRHLQADPLLPSELLPEDWPGDDLRNRHRRFDGVFKSTLSARQRSRGSDDAEPSNGEGVLPTGSVPSEG